MLDLVDALQPLVDLAVRTVSYLLRTAGTNCAFSSLKSVLIRFLANCGVAGSLTS